MAEHLKTNNLPLRLGVMTALLAAYGGLSLYFHIARGVNIVYAHLAYIPIILAGLWWGRKAVLVALLSAGLLISFHIVGMGGGELWTDVVRGLIFVTVALCVGLLSERAAAAQKTRQLSEEKYKLLIEKSLTGIFLYRDDHIVFANSRLCGMLGYGPQEMCGMSIWGLVYGEDKPKVQALVARRKAEGFTDLQYECRFLRKDGGAIWVDLASAVASFEGRPSVLVNVYDISDKKEAEETRRQLSELARNQEDQLVHSTRLAELGEMAAGIAHELNQPLTGIRNFAKNALYMMENSAGNLEEVKENLRLISGQVDRASKIINQMRQFARRSERQFGPVDVNGTLRESVEFLRPQFTLSGALVTLELAENLPPVLGDRVRLEQVFLNLLTNARHAMEESLVKKLLVKTHFEPGKGCPIVIEITDTGKGFTAEESRKFFTPFFSTKKPGHGTGLGLSISLNIVKDHKGTIEATGAPGRGATFRVRLPLGREQSSPEALMGGIE